MHRFKITHASQGYCLRRNFKETYDTKLTCTHLMQFTGNVKLIIGTKWQFQLSLTQKKPFNFL